jgi:hypothetical protein
MLPGDMIEVSLDQARSFQSRAKVVGVKVTTRQLENGMAGVWRLATDADRKGV